MSRLSNSNHQSPMKLLNPQISNNLRHKIQQLQTSFISTMKHPRNIYPTATIFFHFNNEASEKYFAPRKMFPHFGYIGSMEMTSKCARQCRNYFVHLSSSTFQHPPWMFQIVIQPVVWSNNIHCVTAVLDHLSTIEDNLAGSVSQYSIVKIVPLLWEPNNTQLRKKKE